MDRVERGETTWGEEEEEEEEEEERETGVGLVSMAERCRGNITTSSKPIIIAERRIVTVTL